VVSATDPHSRILGFLDWSRYFFFQVAPHAVPDPLLLRKSGMKWTTMRSRHRWKDQY
jgi:hypothetical protein